MHANDGFSVNPILVHLRYLIGLTALVLAPLCLGAGPEPDAAQLFREGQKAEKAGQTVRAYLLYAEAAAKDPQSPAYWMHAQALRPAAMMAQPQSGAALGSKTDEPDKATDTEIDSSLMGPISEQELAEAKRHPLPPPELKAAPGKKDFKLRGDSKSLFEQVAAAFNLLVVFDSAYQPVENVRFEITDVDYREAFRALQDATNSFVVPAADRLILVANDTVQKRQELDSTAAAVIPIPEPFTVQEVQEIGTGIRGTLEIQRLMIDTQRRLMLIRDRAWKVRAAEALIHDLMQPRTQVAIEIDIVTFDETRTSTWGIDLPTQFPLVSFGTLFHNLPKNVIGSSIPAGFANFLTFGGGASFMGLGLTSATLFATAANATATTQLKAEVVTTDGIAASFHDGDKYPIVTGNYVGSTIGQGSYVPPPQFNFEDLGLILKVTPHVHGIDEISLEVSAEFKLLGATAIDGIPIIVNRKLESKVRLMNGEWAVIAGLITKSDMEKMSGIAGLSFIPFLRKNTKEHDHSETLIVLKPHLLNLPPTEALTHTDWIGTETRPRNL